MSPAVRPGPTLFLARSSACSPAPLELSALVPGHLSQCLSSRSSGHPLRPPQTCYSSQFMGQDLDDDSKVFTSKVRAPQKLNIWEVQCFKKSKIMGCGEDD